MLNFFADVPASPQIIAPSTPRTPTPTPAVEPDYAAINIAVAAMAISVIVIVVFALLALKAGKKNGSKKPN